MLLYKISTDKLQILKNRDLVDCVKYTYYCILKFRKQTENNIKYKS